MVSGGEMDLFRTTSHHFKLLLQNPMLSLIPKQLLVGVPLWSSKRFVPSDANAYYPATLFFSIIYESDIQFSETVNTSIIKWLC